jgi:hypothetical protein
MPGRDKAPGRQRKGIFGRKTGEIACIKADFATAFNRTILELKLWAEAFKKTTASLLAVAFWPICLSIN